MSRLVIGGSVVQPGGPVFIVAEAGVNHNGDPAMAHRLIDAAVEAGVDAVKFQTFSAEKVVSPCAPKAAYQLRTAGTSESQLEMVKRLELPHEAFRALQAHAQRRRVLFLSTPYEEESADFLDGLGVPAFKISSGEVTNLPFLSHVARKGRPIILSTGMSDLAEVAEAVRAIRETGNGQLALLHCVSDYPADPREANLRAMGTMAAVFQVPVGYSDHSMGIEVSLAAVALGACVIERHVTLDRRLPGPDHEASLEPGELAALVRGIRTVEAALGDGCKRPTLREAATAAVARKSLVAACDLPSGTRLTEALIAVKRPGTGLPPGLRTQVVGRTLRRDVSAGALLTWDVLGSLTEERRDAKISERELRVAEAQGAGARRESPAGPDGPIRG